jgi:2-polyprenyl-6-methoxyphenol hydroxylase-like FAD-dependent oxidoreductase
MAELGLAGELIDRGIPVREGRAFFEGRPLGTLSFESLPPPFPFVLSVPQHITESVLEERFDSLGNPVVRDINVQGIQQAEQQIVVHGSEQEWVADRVVACDGRHGPVRDMLGIGFQGKPYDAHYVMGDFPDTTSFGPDAAIYLGQDGLVESFPLPNDVRRWVARLEQPFEKDILAKLAEAVSSRTPYHLPVDNCLMTSSFTAERFEAERFYVGGVALAGDAAHVISPIGGQGMNLGWMDADWLDAWIGNGAAPAALANYHRIRRTAFRKAARRSELNMTMGRAGRGNRLRQLLAHLILSRPLRGLFTRLFTMDRLS